MKVLLTGAAGQLGRAIVEQFSRHHEVVAVTRDRLDVRRHAAVLDLVTAERPAVIINCAAYNDVDAAEGDAVTALEVNAFAVRSLARAAQTIGATLVHYSTDFVFDGTAGRPYTEDDEPNPQSVYAASKLLGEWFARDAPGWYVLRVESLFGGGGARSSVDRLLDRIAAGEELRVFTDRTVTPSYTHDVAAATARLLAAGAPFGLYHCVNSGMTTWRDLAVELLRQLGAEAPLVEVTMDQVPLRARRPRFCALSNAKLAAAGIQMAPWQDALRRAFGRQ